jgi:hypothetical protein
MTLVTDLFLKWSLFGLLGARRGCHIALCFQFKGVICGTDFFEKPCGRTDERGMDILLMKVEHGEMEVNEID